MNFLTAYVVIDADDKRLNARLERAIKTTERADERMKKASERTAERSSKRKEQTADRAIKVTERTTERAMKIQERAAERQVKLTERTAQRAMRAAEKAAQKSSKRIARHFTKMGESIRRTFTRIARTVKWAMLAVAGIMGYAIKLAMKQQDVEKRLAITLRATGHAAGFTAEQLLEQASALQEVTRFGDETITAMQTMLLTFKNIRGDMFEEATKAALDMAVAEAAVSGRMVDLTATAIRLGRALNDPLTGMTALSRVGVQFTGTQKNLIRQLMKVGDVAGAQGIILKELGNEFGGMAQDADTAAGALKQMWNAITDVGEKAGEAFLDSIQSSAKNIKEWVKRNEERIGNWAKVIFAYLTFLKDVFLDFVSFLTTDWDAGWKFAKDVSVAAMKDASTEILKEVDDMLNKLHEKLTTGWGTRIHDALRDLLTVESLRESPIGRIVRAPSKWLDKKLGLAPEKIDVITRASVPEPPKEPSALSQVEVPSVISEKFIDSVKVLNEQLELIRSPVEEIEEILDTSLVEPLGKAATEAEELNIKLDASLRGLKAVGDHIGVWMKKSENWGKNLGKILTQTFSNMADELAGALIGMEMNWKSFGRMFIKEILAMIIKMQMLYVWQVLTGTAGTGTGGDPTGGPTQGLLGFGGKLFGKAPGLDTGGTVTKTGWAKVDKGETFSGVNGEFGRANITINTLPGESAEVEEGMNGETVIHIVRQALASDGPTRRMVKQAARS